MSTVTVLRDADSQGQTERLVAPRIAHTLIVASTARAASQDAALLAKAAKNAQGALQWAMAANLYDRAAAALPTDPHTGKETMQAQSHRRSARNCRALVDTNAPNRLIKDAPDYGHMTRKAIAENDEEWRGHGL